MFWNSDNGEDSADNGGKDGDDNGYNNDDDDNGQDGGGDYGSNRCFGSDAAGIVMGIW